MLAFIETYGETARSYAWASRGRPSTYDGAD